MTDSERDKPKRKRRKRPAPPPEPAPLPVTPGWLPRWASAGSVVLAIAYLGMVWLDTTGWRLVESIPRPLHYFGQVACLFPRAAAMRIEYRAEGWLCAEHRWTEIDVRPDFPIDRDEKENRFSRTMHFYREHRPTMEALEAYVVSRHNERAMARQASGEAALGDDLVRRRIGGARFVSVRAPLGEVGSPVARYAYEPLASYAPDTRHEWYWTRASKRRERCAAIAPGSEHFTDDGPAPSRGRRGSPP